MKKAVLMITFLILGIVGLMVAGYLLVKAASAYASAPGVMP